MICAEGTRARLKSGRRGRLVRRPRLIRGRQGLLSRELCLGVPGGGSSKGYRKVAEKRRGPFQITERHQGGRFYRLTTGRAAHYKNIKSLNSSSEDWYIPTDMHEDDYLIVNPPVK